MNDSQLYISAIRLVGADQYPLVDPRDHYAIHRLLCDCFPRLDRSAPAHDVRFLFRVDWESGVPILCVQSKLPPDWSALGPRFKGKIAPPRPLILPPTREGAKLRFRLLARPTKREWKKGGTGRRVSLLEETQQRQWLDRKGRNHGFTVESCVVTACTWYDSKTNERLPDRSLKPLEAIRFDGILVVIESKNLLHAIADGIGTQKAYGFGLLSVTSWSPQS